jgi:hypothetical protein
MTTHPHGKFSSSTSVGMEVGGGGGVKKEQLPLYNPSNNTLVCVCKNMFTDKKEMKCFHRRRFCRRNIYKVQTEYVKKKAI